MDKKLWTEKFRAPRAIELAQHHDVCLTEEESDRLLDYLAQRSEKLQRIAPQ